MSSKKIAVLTIPPLPDWGQLVYDAIIRLGGDPVFCENREEVLAENFAAGWLRFLPSDVGKDDPSYWKAAKALENSGVPIINNMSSRKIAGDKWLSGEKFLEAGLPYPKSWLLTDDVSPDLYPLVCKPRKGSRGLGVTLVDNFQEARDHEIALDTPCLLQKRIDAKKCLRVIATPEKVIRAYEKRITSKTFVASIALGSIREYSFKANQELKDMSKSMVAAVGGDLMGVDILLDQEDRLHPLEINASFAFDPEDEVVAEAMAEKILSLAS